VRRVYRRPLSAATIRPRKEIIGSTEAPRPSRKSPSSHPDLFRGPKLPDANDIPKPDPESQMVIKPHPKRRGHVRRQYARLLKCPKIPRGEGKTCAVVGNATSIFARSDGQIIEGHDLVIRINTPKILSQDVQGTRTDVIYVTDVSIKRLPKLKLPPYTIVSINDHLKEYFDEWSHILRSTVNNEKARPSTGFIAIAHMVYLGYQVHIYGFDWFKTPTIERASVGNKHWEHHYPAWEEEMANKLIASTSPIIEVPLFV